MDKRRLCAPAIRIKATVIMLINPRNRPVIKTARETGRVKIRYKVRVSISCKTSITAENTVLKNEIASMDARPRSVIMRIFCSPPRVPNSKLDRIKMPETEPKHTRRDCVEFR